MARARVDEFRTEMSPYLSLVVTETTNFICKILEFTILCMWFEAIARSPCWISIEATQRSRPMDCPWIRCSGVFELTTKSTALWKCALCGLCRTQSHVWQQFTECARQLAHLYQFIKSTTTAHSAAETKIARATTLPFSFRFPFSQI